MAALGSGPAAAQDAFDPLGFLSGADYSYANGVNADGSVVVGESGPGMMSPQAVRWVDGVITGLGFLPGGATSYANGVNGDGTVVIGTGRNADGNDEAFRWVEGDTGLTGLGFLPGSSSTADSYAHGVSNDGNAVAGYGTNALGSSEAFRWKAGDTALTGLGFISGGNFSYGRDISGDGTSVVGEASNGSGSEAFRWQEGDVGLTGLGFLGGGTFSGANAVNADGSVVVGYSNSADYSLGEAFRWVDDGTADGTTTGLGILAGSIIQKSEAKDVSADGSVVVGSSGSIAFRWEDGDPAGMVSVKQLLVDGGVNMGEWSLYQAFGVSDDGNTIVGYGLDPTMSSNIEAYIARVGPNPGMITPDAAMSSLLSLGQVPGAASSFVNNFLDTTSEYARQLAAGPGMPAMAPLGYADEGDGGPGTAAASTSRFRVFGYGLGGAAIDHDGWSGSALVGASLAMTDHLIIGGSVGYGAVSSDMDLDGRATIRGPAGTMFIASTPATGFQFLATGTIAGLDADIRRGYMNGAGVDSSSGETDGTGYGGLVRVGYAYQMDDQNRIEPFASYQAVHVDLDAYTETGGPFPAAISEMSETDHIGRLGAEVRHNFQPDAWLWGSAAWAHRFDDSGVDLAVQLIDLFGVSGTAPVGSSDWLEATFGVSLPVSVTTRMTGSLTAGLFGEGSDTLVGRVGISTAF